MRSKRGEVVNSHKLKELEYQKLNEIAVKELDKFINEYNTLKNNYKSTLEIKKLKKNQSNAENKIKETKTPLKTDDNQN